MSAWPPGSARRPRALRASLPLGVLAWLCATASAPSPPPVASPPASPSTAAVPSPPAVPSPADPIIIRHDVPDSLYVALGRRFASLVHLNVRIDPPDGEGTLIAPGWVLTAAHVAREIDPGHELTVGGEPHAAARVFIHPEWEDGGPHDVALIRLADPVSGVEPAPLYRGRDEAGALVYVVGIGDTGTGLTGPQRNDGRVRGATNRVDEATDAWLTFRFDDPERDPERVTELEGISGPGDSGGPAYRDVDGVLHVAGVSSGQSSRATGGKPGRYGVVEFYTRVSSYLEWIEETMADGGSVGAAPGDRGAPTSARRGTAR